MRIDFHHRQHRGEGALEREQVAKLLLDHVADHPFGLSAKDVERIRFDSFVRRALNAEQSDLGAVAVRDDDLMFDGHGRDGESGQTHVGTLMFSGHRFSAPQEGVAAECNDNEHVVSPPEQI